MGLTVGVSCRHRVPEPATWPGWIGDQSADANVLEDLPRERGLGHQIEEHVDAPNRQSFHRPICRYCSHWFTANDMKNTNSETKIA